MGERSDYLYRMRHIVCMLYWLVHSIQAISVLFVALLNHGFDSLRLVNPQCHPDDIEARNRAKHAGRVLDSCRMFNTFEEAIVLSSLELQASERLVIKRRNVTSCIHKEFTERVSNIDQDVALVFGEEGKGLSTDDLLRCDYLVTLPTWEGYPITNLSHAGSHAYV